jgi:Peptidase family M28
MTSHRVVVVALLALTLGQPPPGRVPEPAQRAAERVTAAGLSRDLDFLSSDALKGRNTPSPGFDQAAEYIAGRLKQAKLEPAGDDGTFFQYYTMRESEVDTAKAAIEIAGRRFGLGDDFVMRTFAAPVSGARPVVYVGHGWTVPGKDIDPFAGIDVNGKIVVAHGPRALPKGVEIEMVGRINVGAQTVFAEAERRGAAAVLFITQASALQSWEQIRNLNTVVRELDPPVASAYAAVPITSVMVAPQVTDALMAGERVDGPTLRARAEAQDYPASFQLSKSITLTIPAKTATEHHPYNVVAMLKGSDPALRNDYVVVESHLDGAVGTRAVNGDDIYNAADDNATGSAANLAIAEALAAGPRPKRSFIFLWDSGEERGLWGTRYFVYRPPVPLARILVEFNVDMIGANRAPGSPDADDTRTTGPNEVFVIGPRVLSARADALVEGANRGYLNLRLNHEHDRVGSEFFYPRSDAGPFLERGVLTIGFTTGIHERYHLPADEARFLDPRKMEAIARTILVAAWAVADDAERVGIDQPLPAIVPNNQGR